MRNDVRDGVGLASAITIKQRDTPRAGTENEAASAPRVPALRPVAPAPVKRRRRWLSGVAGLLVLAVGGLVWSQVWFGRPTVVAVYIATIAPVTRVLAVNGRIAAVQSVDVRSVDSTILFALIMIIAGLTWAIPAGQYERCVRGAWQECSDTGSYAPTDANPQGFFGVIITSIAGFYDPESYPANAINVALFFLMIGVFIGVVTATGAIDAGIKRAMARLEGREKWMIPILMALFAFGGSTFGMAEETRAFYVILTPVMIAAGHDALTAVAVIWESRWAAGGWPKSVGCSCSPVSP